MLIFEERGVALGAVELHECVFRVGRCGPLSAPIGVGARRADEGSFVPTTNPVVVDLHLPPPWGAPERDSPCDRCNRTTRHYGRRFTSSVDDESDRAAGTVVWFCADCGHRHERGAGNGSLQQNDDALAELFDRH